MKNWSLFVAIVAFAYAILLFSGGMSASKFNAGSGHLFFAISSFLYYLKTKS